MNQLYDKDPYTKTFTATVTEITEGKKGLYEVILDQTAFYPEGGGQPYDTGTFGDANVLAVHEKGEKIIHYLDKPLEKDMQYQGTIDWRRRYDHMQLHSGEHLVSGLIFHHFGFNNVGFHMGSDEVTIDVSGILTKEQLSFIEERANDMVYENLPVKVSYPEESELHSLDYRSKKEILGQVRIVTIPDGDCCACCGTHVKATGEIGLIKFLSMINYKGGVRISLLCGRKALEDYARKQEQVTRISNLLSAKPLSIADAVEKLKQEQLVQESMLTKMMLQFLALKCEGYPKNGNPLFVLEEDLNPYYLRQMCNMLVEQGKGRVVLICSELQADGFQYALGSQSSDMRELSKHLNQVLEGKGGGSQLMAQGTFFASEKQIRKAFMEGCQE